MGQVRFIKFSLNYSGINLCLPLSYHIVFFFGYSFPPIRRLVKIIAIALNFYICFLSNKCGRLTDVTGMVFFQWQMLAIVVNVSE